MKKFDSPFDFEPTEITPTVALKYHNLMEFGQSSPIVGDITVNGWQIDGRFGGPAIIVDNKIFIPIMVRKFLGSCFKMAVINATNLTVDVIGNGHALIWLESVSDETIRYYASHDKSELFSIQI